MSKTTPCPVCGKTFPSDQRMRNHQRDAHRARASVEAERQRRKGVAERADAASPELKTVHIYTDGACHPNPGDGGWGAILMWGGQEKELCGGAAWTTTNRMEMRAAIEALRKLRRHCTVIIHTDSQYLRKGITKWISGWKRNGWMTASRTQVKNADLWQELDRLCGLHTVDWRWVKGHAGNPGNERADRLAARGRLEGIEQRRAVAAQPRRQAAQEMENVHA